MLGGHFAFFLYLEISENSTWINQASEDVTHTRKHIQPRTYTQLKRGRKYTQLKRGRKYTQLKLEVK